MPWYALDLNPEPWAVGPVGYARRGGKMSAYVGRNQQLDSYKEAVRESLKTDYTLPPMIEGPVELKIFFWRNRAEYVTPQARTHRKHEADLTNLVKSTEDALQGVLFKNDRDVHHTEAYLVEQGPDVAGRIIIFCDEAEPHVNPDLIPDYVWNYLDDSQLDLDEAERPVIPFQSEGEVPF